MIFKVGFHGLGAVLWGALVAFYAVACDDSIELEEVLKIPPLLSEKSAQEIVIKTIKESYQILNEAGRYSSPLYHHAGEYRPIYVPGWKVKLKYGQYLGSGSGYCLLTKDPQFSMGKALDKAFSGKGVMDDRIAAELVFLRCLQEMFGRKTLDFITQANYRKDLALNQIDTQYGGGLVRLFSYEKKWGPHSMGTWVCFANNEFYDKKHPYGMAHHLHAFYVGNNENGQSLYMGYGPFFTQEKTQEEILTYLHSEFCCSSDQATSPYLLHNHWLMCEKIYNLCGVPRIWIEDQNKCQNQMSMVFFNFDIIMQLDKYLKRSSIGCIG